MQAIEAVKKFYKTSLNVHTSLNLLLEETRVWAVGKPSPQLFSDIDALCEIMDWKITGFRRGAESLVFLCEDHGLVIRVGLETLLFSHPAAIATPVIGNFKYQSSNQIGISVQIAPLCRSILHQYMLEEGISPDNTSRGHVLNKEHYLDFLEPFKSLIWERLTEFGKNYTDKVFYHPKDLYVFSNRSLVWAKNWSILQTDMGTKPIIIDPGALYLAAEVNSPMYDSETEKNAFFTAYGRILGTSLDDLAIKISSQLAANPIHNLDIQSSRKTKIINANDTSFGHFSVFLPALTPP